MPVAVEDGALGRLLAAKKGGEHAVVRVPDQLRVQLRELLPHVHNVHIAARTEADAEQEEQEEDDGDEQGSHDRRRASFERKQGRW